MRSTRSEQNSLMLTSAEPASRNQSVTPTMSRKLGEWLDWCGGCAARRRVGDFMVQELFRFSRNDDESELEYQFRVSSMKDAIGTWDDVADIINAELGYQYTESKYRKDYVTFQKMLEAHAANSDNEATQRMLEAAEELRKERHKITATKLELHREERKSARMELFYENMKDAFDRLPVPKPETVRSNAAPSDGELVLTISDIHYGASFKSKNNEYSRDICKERFWKLLDEMKGYAGLFDTIKVLNLGDTLQGILRMKDLQLNDIPVVESVVEISRILSAFLNELSKWFKVEYYHCIAANHTQIRPLGSKANELVAEDLEKIIVCNIEDSLADNGRVIVNYDLTADYIPFKIMDFQCVATHGHQIKNRSSLISDLSNLHGCMYDYVFIGHDHSAKEEIFFEGAHHNREVLTCPGFIGSDPFSDSLLRGCRPAAKLFMFDEVQGHIMSHSILF